MRSFHLGYTAYPSTHPGNGSKEYSKMFLGITLEEISERFRITVIEKNLGKPS